MKVRLGFVSNSSSSSFTCCICDHNETEYEISISDVGMVECSNGHTMCEDHLPTVDDKDLVLAIVERRSISGYDPERYKELLEFYQNYEGESECCGEVVESKFCPDCGKPKSELEHSIDSDYWYNQLRDLDWRYSYPAKYCPVCTLNEINDSYILDYLEHVGHTTRKDVMSQLRQEFVNYKSFYNAVIKNK